MLGDGWEKKLIKMIRHPYQEAYRTNNVFMNEVTLIVGPHAYRETRLEAANPNFANHLPASRKDLSADVHAQWMDETKEQLTAIEGLRITAIDYAQGKITVIEEESGALAEAMKLGTVLQGHTARGQMGWYR